MRLICPNCGAQYEVDSEVIPAGGRDVECSACGQVWLVKLPGDGPGLAGGQGPDPEPGAAGDEGEAASESPEGPEEAAEPVAEMTEAGPGAEDPAEEDEAEAGSGPGEEPAGLRDEDRPIITPPPPRPTVTPAIADILRAEAERERAARAAAAAAAAAAVEKQDEFAAAPQGRGHPGREAAPDDDGVRDAAESRADVAAPVRPVAAEAGGTGGDDDGNPASDDLAAAIKKIVAEEADRIVMETPAPRSAASIDVPPAAVRAAEPPQEPSDQLATASRRDRLPDIEEISSTLSPETEAPAPEPAPVAAGRRRSGRSFRTGFVLVLLLAAVLMGVYLNARPIAEAFPQAERVVTAYVAVVDESRLWLDQQVRRLLEWMGSAAPAE